LFEKVNLLVLVSGGVEVGDVLAEHCVDDKILAFSLAAFLRI
jgi:hypothetical protein